MNGATDILHTAKVVGVPHWGLKPVTAITNYLSRSSHPATVTDTGGFSNPASHSKNMATASSPDIDPQSILSDRIRSLAMTTPIKGATKEALIDNLEQIYRGRGFRPPTQQIADGLVKRHEATSTHTPYREFMRQYDVATEAMETELESIAAYFTAARHENSLPVFLYYPIVGIRNTGPLPARAQYLGRVTATIDEGHSPDGNSRSGPTLVFKELHEAKLGEPVKPVVEATSDETAALPVRTFKQLWHPA